MKSATSAQRPYQEVGAMIRDLIIKTPYNPGERLPVSYTHLTLPTTR
ncbi:hypothetical protein ACX3V1_13335, partial [Escherichia coli]